MADTPLVEKGNIDPLSGDPAQYLINPVTQDVEFATTLSDAARLRDEQQFVPATSQQIDLFRKGYQALQKEQAERARVRAEPVKQRAATFAERLGEFLNPADIAYGLGLGARVGLEQEQEKFKEGAAERPKLGFRVRPPGPGESRATLEPITEPVEQAFPITAGALPAATTAFAPLVTRAVETKLGITTPEAIRAREEEFPGMGWAAMAASIVTPAGIETALEKGAMRVGRKALVAKGSAVLSGYEAERALDATRKATLPALAEADAAVVRATEDVALARGAGTPQEIAEAEGRLVAAQKNAAQAQSIYDSAISAAEGRLSPERLPAATPAEARKAAAEAFKAQEAAIKASTDAETYAARADLLKSLGKKRAPTAMNLVSEGIGRPIVEASEQAANAAINRIPGVNRAPQIVKNIVAKGIANGLGSAAEGAVFSLGHVANEDVLGPDHRLTGEQILAAMEDGAWFGLKIGGALGAGMPAAKGIGNAVASATAKTRDAMNRWYGDFAVRRTGARPDTLQVAYDTRARFLTEDPGAVIEQEILNRRPAPPEPVAPIMPEAPTPTPIPEKPLPYKPETFPAFEPETKLGRPAPPELRPVDFDKAAFEVSDALDNELEQVDRMHKSFYQERAPAEDIPLVNEYYDGLIRSERTKAKDAYLESIGGKTRSAAEHEQLQVIMREAVNEAKARPARELDRLIEHAKGVIKTTIQDEPRAKPIGVIRAMKQIVADLEKSRSNATLPSDFATAIDIGKRRFYELGEEPGYGVVETSVDQIGRQAARDAGKEFLLSRLDADLWGDAAARTERRNDAFTDYSAALRDFEGLISYPEAKGVAGMGRRVDPEKIRKWLENKDRPAGERLNRAYERYTAARDRLAYEFKVSTRRAEGATELGPAEGAIEQTARAYEDAQATILADAQNQIQAAERKALEGEIARLNEEIANRNEIRKAEHEALEREFNAAEGAKKEEAAQRIAEWKIEEVAIKERNEKAVEAYEQKLSELKKKHVEETKQWKQQLKDREADAADQVKILKYGMSAGSPAENVLIGYLAGKSKNPVIKGSAVAYKGGKAFLEDPIRAYRRLAWMEKKVNSIRRFINEDVDNFIFGPRRGIKSVGMAAGMLSGDALDTEYERIKKEIRKLSADPLARHAALDAATEPIETIAPKTADAVQNTLATAQAVVEARVPKPPANLAPVAKANWKPTTAEKKRLVNAYDIVNNPKNAARRILAGASTADERQIMDDVYPAMMEMMRQRIIKNMRDNPQLDRQRAAIAGQILGVDLTGDLDLGISAQQQYQMQMPTPQDQQKKMKIGQGKALERMPGRLNIEKRAWMEAQEQQ